MFAHIRITGIHAKCFNSNKFPMHNHNHWEMNRWRNIFTFSKSQRSLKGSLWYSNRGAWTWNWVFLLWNAAMPQRTHCQHRHDVCAEISRNPRCIEAQRNALEMVLLNEVKNSLHHLIMSSMTKLLLKSFYWCYKIKRESSVMQHRRLRF